MQENRSNGVQKLIKYSAYVAILNKLRDKDKITEIEYEKIRKKIDKKS